MHCLRIKPFGAQFGSKKLCARCLQSSKYFASSEIPSEIADHDKMMEIERNVSNSDPRIEKDYKETRIDGPKRKQRYNRSFIEKQHIDYGWSKNNDQNVNLWFDEPKYRHNNNIANNDGNNRDASFIRGESKYDNRTKKDFSKHSDAMIEISRFGNNNNNNNDDSSNNNNENENGYNVNNDLTTFESFSTFSRSATYKAALNLGVHWGKDKNKWHPSMAPYLKGVINNKHVFDLSLIISNLRKVIRLLQSLIMDDCKILFVGTSANRDLRNIIKIMSCRVNIPCLDIDFAQGSIMDWDSFAAASRGPGKSIMFKPESRKIFEFKPDKKYDKTRLHRLMQSPPDFIFIFDRSANTMDELIHEANGAGVPVAALCDSDNTTRDLQYVIPCNTSSLQSIHFICDMITRGILEAQYKKDSLWWAQKQDYNDTLKLIKQVESNWQANFDPYESVRQGQSLTGGASSSSSSSSNTSLMADIKLPILTPGDYSIADENVTFDRMNSKRRQFSINKYGTILNNPNRKNQEQFERGVSNEMNEHEQSRLSQHENVIDSQKYQLLQKEGFFKHKQDLIDDSYDSQQEASANDLAALSTKYFVNEMLEKYAKTTK